VGSDSASTIGDVEVNEPWILGVPLAPAVIAEQIGWWTHPSAVSETTASAA
jgi:hypothetical protein